MRDRLIELLLKKYDHFCDQCGVNKDSHYTDNLADYLLANGVIVPPCKVGDKVYHIRESTCENVDGLYTICEFYDEGMCACKTRCPHIHRIVECYVDMVNLPRVMEKWGKTIFLTKEEAEKALQRKEDEGK